jgi:SAM-dependent methyltransferase
VRGGALDIPLEPASVDCLYAMIALQHVADLDGALAEAARVLRPGGIMVVFDRNPASIRGLLKPWHELRGRWMYDWDSPFRERWRLPGRWRAHLRRAGLEPVRTRTMTSWDGKGLRRLLPINRFILIQARKKPSSTGPGEVMESGSARPDVAGQGD